MLAGQVQLGADNVQDKVAVQVDAQFCALLRIWTAYVRPWNAPSSQDLTSRNDCSRVMSYTMTAACDPLQVASVLRLACVHHPHR
jgi:hypothetical protein